MHRKFWRLRRHDGFVLGPWMWVSIWLVGFVVLITLSGCKSQPEAEPVLTPQEIVETPDKKKRACLKIENLPKCRNDGIYVIEYRNRLTECIWSWSCVSRRRGIF